MLSISIEALTMSAPGTMVYQARSDTLSFFFRPGTLTHRRTSSLGMHGTKGIQTPALPQVSLFPSLVCEDKARQTMSIAPGVVCTVIGSTLPNVP